MELYKILYHNFTSLSALRYSQQQNCVISLIQIIQHLQKNKTQPDVNTFKNFFNFKIIIKQMCVYNIKEQVSGKTKTIINLNMHQHTIKGVHVIS